MMTLVSRPLARVPAAAAVLAMSLLALTGCAPSHPTPQSPAAPTAGVTSASSPATTAARAASPSSSLPSSRSSDPAAEVDKILVVVEENRSPGDVAAHMPFLMSKARAYGTATHYYAITHPSLPNYLALAGGSTFGVHDDEAPDVHHLGGRSVFGMLLASGHSAKTYAEAMPGTCATRNHGTYGVRHNPWTYFADPRERAACRRFDVPAGKPTRGALADDVAAGDLPDFGLLIPDVCHDGHDCSAATTDRWLRSWLPTLTNGPDFQSGRLAVIITWDEDDDHSGNHIPLIVLHPSLNGRVVKDHLDHYALSASISRVAGDRPLRKAGRAPDLLAAFDLD
jgi:hypothetical protein